ncbi:MAG: AzlD domain-containing protein [Chloroflexi bacterium]|nr:AzlD domain-containing protein [Chloroflexota bacterium]OJV91193.1 MAG: hypothetical protein BGO39_26425 [Chloroflexi bacterium 54-19]
MTINLEVLLTILGMAAVTYLTRWLGPFLMSRVTLSKKLETWLSYLPGTILVSLVLPDLISSGVAGVIAGFASLVAARLSGNLFLALVVGVVTVWAGRSLLG